MNIHKVTALLGGLLVALTSGAATGKRISDYTETLTVGDAWLYEIAVPGVTNYKVTFGTMASNIIARVPAGTGDVTTVQLYTAVTNKVDNVNGQVTNLTSRGLKLPAITAARPLFIDASGNITNVSGTPNGTQFVRDDGTLAVPGGGGDVTTAQLNTASNAVVMMLIANDTTTSNGLFSAETTRNAAVSNGVVTLLVANDTTTSNGLYAVETTRNAAVSNAVVALITASESGSNKVNMLNGLATNLTVNSVVGGASLALTVDTNVLVVTGGQTGFGTNAPSSRVHVRPATSGTSYLRVDHSDGTRRLQVGVYPGSPSIAALWLGDISPSVVNYTFASDGTESYFNAAGGLHFSSGAGPERWNINSSGHLVGFINDTYDILGVRQMGIGLLAPVNKLDVEGAVAIGVSYSGTSTAPANGAIIQGDLGIATASPTNRMDVNGHASIRSNLFLPNLPTNGSPVAFLATDAAGKVYETASSSGGGGGTNFPPITTTGTNITVGTGVRKSLLMPTNTHAGISFNGTELLGESVTLVVTNTSAQASNITVRFFQDGVASTYFDALVASNVAGFLVVSNSSRTMEFVYNGTFWRLESSYNKELELVVSGGLTLSTNSTLDTVTLATLPSTNSFIPLLVNGTTVTNFTFASTNAEVVMNGAANVNITGITGGAAGRVEYANLTITNGSGSNKTFSFQETNNLISWASVYGTNAPVALTNNTALMLSLRIHGTNVRAGYVYFPWP